jgi:hypothetical protein
VDAIQQPHRFVVGSLAVILGLGSLTSCVGDSGASMAVRPVPAEIWRVLNKAANRNAVWAQHVVDLRFGKVTDGMNAVFV